MNKLTKILYNTIILILIISIYRHLNTLHFFCNNYLNNLALNFSSPKTSTMVGIIELHEYIMFFLFVILIFTIYFLVLSVNTASYPEKGLYKANTINDRKQIRSSINYYISNKLNLSFSHHPLLEFIWTLLPAIILIFLAYPSFILLYTMDSCLNPLYTVIIIGNQWFWTYEYSDFDVHQYLITSIENSKCFSSLISITKEADIDEAEKAKSVSFFLDKNLFNKLIHKTCTALDLESKIKITSNLLTENMLPLGYPRLLSTDQVLVLPSKTPIRLLITSNDVLHSWAVPCFGIKMDACPGRLNQVYLYTEFLGTSWGQCSELCGVNHGFMPIEIRILKLRDFLQFIHIKLNGIISEPFNNFYLFAVKTISDCAKVEVPLPIAREQYFFIVKSFFTSTFFSKPINSDLYISGSNVQTFLKNIHK